jgi:hypothetical protein
VRLRLELASWADPAGIATWTANTTYMGGAYVKPSSGTHYYKATTSGMSGSSAPTFPTDGTTVTDGTVIWQDAGPDTDWILRNEWHRQLYYSIAPAFAFDGGGWCGSCLTVNGVTPATSKRAVLVFAGRQLNATKLSGPINNSQTSITVASATGAPAAGFRVRIDKELLLVTAVAGTTWTVARGVDGTTATAHPGGAEVLHATRRSTSPAPSPLSPAVVADYLEDENQTTGDRDYRSGPHILTATAVTRTGATVTVNATGHGLAVGSRVRVQGASQQDYNGRWTVASVPNSESFTYQLLPGSAPASPATGQVVIESLRNDRVAILAP